MKKFGLRALAGGLAALMVATVFAPATVANASDVILIAPNPNAAKTLYVTEDMVDEDGEIVISGGNYDRIVVSKEAAAKDIYFDQVEVGELVVESGNKTNIQLWEVDAETVTVQEPKLAELKLQDLKTLLAEEETRQMALDLFMESRAKDEYALNTAPKIITKEDAKVDEVVTRANAKLDLGDGEVGGVTLQASDTIRRADVTLSNYQGDVTYKGGDTYNVTNLRNVDSRIKTLTVDESTDVNRFNVTAKNAVVLAAKVSGNAKVSLNAPTGVIEIAEEATAADVCIFNAADELNVKADGAKVELAPNGNIVLATVSSDNVKITGKGTLTEADLDGKGAYVSTSGTKVEGENTYVPPVYVETPFDSWSEDFADASITELVPTDGASMNWAKYAYNEEGYAEVTADANYSGFAVTLDNRDNGSVARYEISLKIKLLEGTSKTFRMTESSNWKSYGNDVTVTDSWQTIKTNHISVDAGGVQTVLFAPGNSESSAKFAIDDVVVKRYTDWTEPPARPKPTEDKTFTFGDMKYSSGYGNTYTISGNGALNISYTGENQEAQFEIPEEMYTDDYNKIKIDFESINSGYALCFKIFAGGKNIKTVYGKSSDCTIDLSDCAGYAVTKIGIMQNCAGTDCGAVLNGVTFVVAGSTSDENQGGTGSDTSAPVIPEGAYTFDKVVEAKSGWNATMELNDNKGVVVTFTGDYSQAFFKIPDEVDITKLESFTLNGIKESDYQIRLLTSDKLDSYDGSNGIEKSWDTATVSTDGNTDIKYFVLVSKVAQKITVDSISFKLKADSTEEDKDTTVTLPELPTGSVVYDFDDFTVENNWGGTVSTEDGVLEVEFGATSNEVRYSLPEEIDVADYKEVRFIVKTPGTETTDQVAFKVYANDADVDQWNNPATLKAVYGVASTSPTVAVIDLTGDDCQGKVIDRFGVMANNGACSATVYKVAFVPKETTGGGESGSGSTTPQVTVEIATPAMTTLTLDDTLTLTAAASDAEGTITWSSSNQEVATVSADGVVTPVGKGDVTITATCGTATDTVDLTVEKAFYIKSWSTEQNKWVVASKNVAFDVTAAPPSWNPSGDPVASVVTFGFWNGTTCYLPDMLPAALASDTTLKAALATHEGIFANVEKFVFDATITSCTDSSIYFQGMVQEGSPNYAGIYKTKTVEGVTDANPVQVIAEGTIEEFKTVNDSELVQVGIQITNVDDGAQISGTYSIKVVLK